MWKWLALLCLSVVVLLGAPLAGIAAAQSPECAEADLDASGLTGSEAELRRLRNDVRVLCAVVADVGATAEQDAADASASAQDRADRLDALDAHLLQVRDLLDAPLDVHPDLGRDPASASYVVDESAHVVAQDAYAGLHADLWFLIGLGATFIAAYALYRQVMPRA